VVGERVGIFEGYGLGIGVDGGFVGAAVGLAEGKIVSIPVVGKSVGE